MRGCKSGRLWGVARGSWFERITETGVTPDFRNDWKPLMLGLYGEINKGVGREARDGRSHKGAKNPRRPIRLL